MLRKHDMKQIWSIDMQRPFHPDIFATDASTEFGYGACMARLGVTGARALSKLDAKVGDHAVLEGPSPDDGRIYSGTPCTIPLSHRDFRVVLSIRVADDEHINVREGRAFLCTIRWLLRSSARHRTRLIVLVDSRVWLGAALKGRSGSLPLNALLRQLAALVMGSGIVLHLVFIPTAWNPSDALSRGVPMKGGRRSAKPQPPDPLDLLVNRHRASVERLLETGMLTKSDVDLPF